LKICLEGGRSIAGKNYENIFEKPLDFYFARGTVPANVRILPGVEVNMSEMRLSDCIVYGGTAYCVKEDGTPAVVRIKDIEPLAVS
jgi:hypothetical protein